MPARNKPAPKLPALNEDRIRRGKNDTVALTVRLPKADWIALRNYAMNEGETLQSIAVRAFNREMTAKGHPPLKGGE